MQAKYSKNLSFVVISTLFLYQSYSSKYSFLNSFDEQLYIATTHVRIYIHKKLKLLLTFCRLYYKLYSTWSHVTSHWM